MQSISGSECKEVFLVRQLFARPILALGVVAGMFVFASPVAADASQGTTGLSASRPSRAALAALAKDKAAIRDLYFALLAGRTTATVYQAALRSFAVRYGEASTPALATASGRSALCPTMGNVAVPSSPYCVGNRSWNTVNLTNAGELKCTWTNPVSYCYCGPATAYAMLQQLGYPTSHSGEALSQDNLAITKYLETRYWGGQTPWSGIQGDHPMPETLNYWRTGSYSGYYEADGLGMPTKAPDTSTFENDVRYDIDTGWSVAANITEVYNGYHLAGHPNTRTTIGHWLPIYGYSNFGATFNYADPASSIPSSWGWNVKPTNTDSAANFSGLVQARGIVW
jgi:hypothetical protein